MTKMILLWLGLFSIEAAPFSLVSYNVQNLFDNKQTKGHRDYTYLAKDDPLKTNCKLEKSDYYRRYCKKLDWNEEKIATRIKLLRKVLKSSPQVPSLLGLVEIETKELALRLGEEFGLKKVVMTSGSDERGIQSALLFNEKVWELIEKKEWSFDFATRNLLEVHLRNKEEKKKLIIFVNHWPSQRSPTEKRLVLARKLVERLEKFKGEAVVAVGDFNTLPRENPHPFHQELLLKGRMNEVDFKKGTYFYAPKMSWNHLDRVFFRGPLATQSSQVIAPEFATGVYEYTNKKRDFWGSRVVGIPKKADFLKKKKMGYSDHFPVYVEFDWTSGK